jgi:hypothetical protein
MRASDAVPPLRACARRVASPARATPFAAPDFYFAARQNESATPKNHSTVAAEPSSGAGPSPGHAAGRFFAPGEPTRRAAESFCRTGKTFCHAEKPFRGACFIRHHAVKPAVKHRQPTHYA